MLPDFDMGATLPPPPPPPEEEQQSLQDVNLAHELVRQYKLANALYEDAKLDLEATPQQKAAVLNTIRSILQQIITMQTALYNAERMKRLESILLNTLKTLPEAARLQFMSDYERELARD